MQATSFSDNKLGEAILRVAVKMSFPNTDNSLRTTVSHLKDVVSRHQGADHETVQIVRELETIIAEIERKTGSAVPSKGSEMVVPGAVAGVVPVV